MLKKALLPILVIAGAIVVLAAVAYFYEQKWGLHGPFPSEHHHGGGGGEAEGHDHTGHDHDHHDHDGHEHH